MSHSVLVDTSVWVEYFRRGESRSAILLDELLEAGVVVMCAPVKAEVLSGAPAKAQFQKLKDLLEGLPMSEAPKDMWDRIAQTRFLLARKGIQATVIDLWIAIVAEQEQLLMWTLDKDFLAIRDVVHFAVFDPDAVRKSPDKKTLS
jgi:predicted nucleic acid-binding protein